MTNARFQPRNYAVTPNSFGTELELQWRTLPARASSDQEDQLGAAQLQHRLSIAIRLAAVRRHGSVRAYCDFRDLSYQRTARMLRGEVVMRLEDVANARRNLGIDFPAGVSLP